MTNATTIAPTNFNVHLRHNPYPGRGLVIAHSSNLDAWLMVYWIMGRSTQSRNRRFVAIDGTLRTEPVDASLVTDPSLIIYDAMLELPGVYLVSNGDQTRTFIMDYNLAARLILLWQPVNMNPMHLTTHLVSVVCLISEIKRQPSLLAS